MTKFNQSTYDQATASVCTLTDNANYQSDPLSVYQLLCHDKKNNLLLESAEIDQKHLLKSLLLVDAALKIVCNDNVVTFTALTHNGQTALQFAAAQLQNHAKLSLCEKNQILTATFPDTPTELDEQSRLMAINPFESLRLFNRIENSDNHHFAIFLGGAFAFDMISMSETLPKVPDGENTCPDFVYYLAETVVVIDHEKRSTEIIANLFSSSSEENSMQADPTESAERIAHIKQLLSKNITTESILPLIERNDSNFNDAQVVSVDISDEQFCKNVETLKENIRAGDIFQVVPSRTFSLPCLDSIAAYQALKLSNQALICSTLKIATLVCLVLLLSRLSNINKTLLKEATS